MGFPVNGPLRRIWNYFSWGFELNLLLMWIHELLRNSIFFNYTLLGVKLTSSVPNPQPLFYERLATITIVYNLYFVADPKYLSSLLILSSGEMSGQNWHNDSYAFPFSFFRLWFSFLNDCLFQVFIIFSRRGTGNLAYEISRIALATHICVYFLFIYLSQPQHW